MSLNRTFVAFLAAPLVTPFVFVANYYLGHNFGAVSIDNIFNNFVLSALVYLPAAYAGELLLGWPVWAYFRNHGIRSAAAFALAGALIGSIIVFAIGRLAEFSIANPFSVSWIRGGALAAILTAILIALIFRAIASVNPRHATITV